MTSLNIWKTIKASSISVCVTLITKRWSGTKTRLQYASIVASCWTFIWLGKRWSFSRAATLLVHYAICKNCATPTGARKTMMSLSTCIGTDLLGLSESLPALILFREMTRIVSRRKIWGEDIAILIRKRSWRKRWVLWAEKKRTLSALSKSSLLRLQRISLIEAVSF